MESDFYWGNDERASAIKTAFHPDLRIARRCGGVRNDPA
jgi:hypothetical protein